MKRILRLNSVSLKFGGLTALSNVSLGIPHLGIHGIIGPNGAGKSTLFNLVTGIYHPSQGSIHFEDLEIHQLNTAKICQLGIARTFQNIRLLPHLSALENLLVVTSLEKRGKFWETLLRLPRSRKLHNEIKERAHSLLNLVGLRNVENKSPTSLPYGDQRKLEIARALMRKPKLLLLDEPAAGMNPNEKNALNLALRKIIAEDITVLIIEHDMKFMMNSCQKITVLNQGTICAEGSPAEIQSNPLVIESYLGKKASQILR